MYWDDEFMDGNVPEERSGEESGAEEIKDENVQASEEDGPQEAASNLEFTAQVEVNEARERVRAQEEAAEEADAEDAPTTYRYTTLPYSRETIGDDAGPGPEPEKAPEEPKAPKEETPRKRKAPKKQSTGKAVLKFIGKCVAAAVIFGLVASLTFNGVNGLLGSSSSESSSVTSVEEALVSSASGDASSTTVSVGTATALDVSDVVENVMPAIVAVTSYYVSTSSYGFGLDDSSTTSASAGSGIIVAQTDETLYIVTNNHVVEDADSVTVTLVDDSEVEAEIKGTDSTNDLAVLSVSISSLSADTLSSITVATLGDSDAIEVGETTIAIGNALGYGQSVTTGIVSALNREVTIDGVTSLLIQTDAAINPGNSGGALLNASGEVIGINSAKYADTDVEGMGYAIPINTAIPIINELIEKEKVSDSEASYMGIYGLDVSDEVSEYYSLPQGVYISQVESGSPAEEAGIQAGDILTAFDGKTITSMEGLQSLMEYYAAGTTVEVTVQRANNGVYEEVTLSVTLGYKNS